MYVCWTTCAWCTVSSTCTHTMQSAAASDDLTSIDSCQLSSLMTLHWFIHIIKYLYPFSSYIHHSWLLGLHVCAPLQVVIGEEYLVRKLCMYIITECTHAYTYCVCHYTYILQLRKLMLSNCAQTWSWSNSSTAMASVALLWLVFGQAQSGTSTTPVHHEGITDLQCSWSMASEILTHS